MEIIPLCPFTVGTVIWQGQGGDFTLTTCVKGTFKLAHGRDALIADEQEPIGGDRYYAGSGGGLYAPSDIAPYKPRSDVLLVGHAYAPGGKPVDALVARFTVGDLTKAIGIIGDRLWTEGPYGLEPSTPSQFTRMPLRYERAARGPSNPIGVDLAAPPLAGGRALPNLEAVDDDAGHDLTVGFGPLAPGWAPRRNLLHAAALAWVAEGCQGPVPEGFEFGFYNTAPRDQQVDLLRHSAKIVLENLHPEHPRLETRLPNIRPKAFLIDRLTRRGTEIALRCDTIWIDTDRGIAVVTWRGLTGVETGDPRALGTLAVAAEMKGKELRFKHVERLLAEEGFTSADTESFTMSDVNPLNVRYDGVVLSEVPPATTELPVPSVGGPPPSSSLLRPAPPAPPAISALVPDEPTAETTTQRISVYDVRAHALAAAPSAPREPSPSGVELAVETTSTEAPTVQMKMERASHPSAPDRQSPPAPAPPDGSEEGEDDTVQVALKRPLLGGPTAGLPGSPTPQRKPLQAPKPAAPAAPRPAQAAPRPAPAARALPGIPVPPGPVPPPIPASQAAPPLVAPAPLPSARGVGLADYARIQVALERGETTRIQARLKLDAADLARVRAEWADRIKSEPDLQARLDEAMEAARWE